MSTTCAQCGNDEFEAHVTAYGVDLLPEIVDAVILIDPGTIENPDSVTIEAICNECKHVRYLNQHEWEWA